MNHFNDILSLSFSNILDFIQHDNFATWIGIFISLFWNFINYRNNKKQNEVRLRLIPTTTTTSKFPNVRIPAWHIINLSSFNISIQEVGFAHVHRTFPFFRHAVSNKKVVYSTRCLQIPNINYIHEDYIKTNIMPLGSREALILAVDYKDDIKYAKLSCNSMYVSTVCGHTVFCDARSILDSVDINKIERGT